jgi:flavin reductase (DIM6/NTAB) family NADH-FMN oxidoreductase RutF
MKKIFLPDADHKLSTITRRPMSHGLRLPPRAFPRPRADPTAKPENALRRVTAQDLDQALGLIPGGLFILTSHFEDRRAAVLVKWAQQCSSNPPMVMFAMSKGLAIEPLIRDSHCFVLCQISADDRFLIRKFLYMQQAGEDPLVTMMTSTAPSGSPIVDRAMSYLDCQVVRHIELESDFRIYVGQVQSGAVLHLAAPAICLGGNTTNGNGDSIGRTNHNGSSSSP